MTWTNFPNGISVTTQTGVGAGQINSESVIGNVWSETVSFGTGSAAQTVVAGAPPQWATDLVGVFVTIGSVSAIVAAYTVRGGSAGTVHVSSENNTAGVEYSKSSLAIDTPTITTTAGLQVVRGVQGTAGDSYLTMVFKRTA